MEKTMDKIVAVAKSRGFVYPGSEIYGGLANTWDYGPLGVELKNNVKKAWWQKFVMESPHNVGVDCAILMNPQTWVASGHLGGFSDPLMDCKECHERFRADKLIEDYMTDNGIEIEGSIDGWTNEQMEQYVEEKGLKTVNDEGALRKVVEEVIAANPQSVEDYHNGKEKAIGFLVGQTMKAMKGKAAPASVNQMLKELL